MPVKSKKRFAQKKRRQLIILAVILIAASISFILLRNRDEPAANTPTGSQIEDQLPGEAEAANPIEEPEEKPEQQWPVILSKGQASSITVVVNKKHKLPSDYVPALRAVAGGQMRFEAADALVNLLQKAKDEGMPMGILSSYRSYSTQVSTYNKWVAQDGQAAADTYSARPGHSEHQTGLAVDLGNGTCDLETCFGDTDAGKWLAAHAHEHGFIIRYEKGKDSVTGYQYEPWHLRYVGKEVAQAIVASGITMDEYFNVTGGGYN